MMLKFDFTKYKKLFDEIVNRETVNQNVEMHIKRCKIYWTLANIMGNGRNYEYRRHDMMCVPQKRIVLMTNDFANKMCNPDVYLWHYEFNGKCNVLYKTGDYESKHKPHFEYFGEIMDYCGNACVLEVVPEYEYIFKYLISLGFKIMVKWADYGDFQLALDYSHWDDENENNRLDQFLLLCSECPRKSWDNDCNNESNIKFMELVTQIRLYWCLLDMIVYRKVNDDDDNRYPLFNVVELMELYDLKERDLVWYELCYFSCNSFVRDTIEFKNGDFTIYILKSEEYLWNFVVKLGFNFTDQTQNALVIRLKLQASR